jgi:DNA-binding response OmpR family regulator
MRVVIVDDDEGMRESLADLLGDEGYAVEAYTTAEEALAGLTKGAPPDVILLDYRVPEMGAEQLVKELDARGVPTPILLVTGASPDDISAPLLHLAGVVQKPFGIGDFLETVAAVARGSGERA